MPNSCMLCSADRGTATVDTLLMRQGAVYIASRSRVLCVMLARRVWESNPKLQGGWCKPNHQGIRRPEFLYSLIVCVYYCRTYYKAVCGGGGGQ
jgi:hypothetical protein